MTRSINLSEQELKDIVAGKLPATLVKKATTALKPRGARYGKSKGMRGQTWVADRISRILNLEWEQSDDNSPIAVRPASQHGCDIILRGKAFTDFPFDIECKWSESFTFVDTIEQAKANTNYRAGRDFLIVHNRKAFEQPVVIMEWDTFEKLFQK